MTIFTYYYKSVEMDFIITNQMELPKDECHLHHAVYWWSESL